MVILRLVGSGDGFGLPERIQLVIESLDFLFEFGDFFDFLSKFLVEFVNFEVLVH
jgi:hypothetical protein